MRYTIFPFFLLFKNQEHIWSGVWPWPKFASIYIDIESVVKKASKAKVRIYTYNTSSDTYTKAVSKAMLMLALLYPKRTMPILRPWWTCDLSLLKNLCFTLIYIIYKMIPRRVHQVWIFRVWDLLDYLDNSETEWYEWYSSMWYIVLQVRNKTFTQSLGILSPSLYHPNIEGLQKWSQFHAHDLQK